MEGAGLSVSPVMEKFTYIEKQARSLGVWPTSLGEGRPAWKYEQDSRGPDTRTFAGDQGGHLLEMLSGTCFTFIVFTQNLLTQNTLRRNPRCSTVSSLG